MKVFVSGTESFIARAFISLCEARGIEICGVDAAAPSGRPGRMTMDIRSSGVADAIPLDVDAVVHLAAISRDADCRANPRLAYDVNIQGTVNLIEAAKARKAKQFVFASSEWVYGEVTNDAVQTEDQPLDATRLKSEYALTKLAGEQVLRLAHAQGLPAATILRFGIVYGPRPANWSAVESLVDTVRRGGPVRTGSRRTARRFIHVSDIASGIMASLGRTGCETFNISGDRLVTLGEVVETAERILGHRVEVQETAPQAASVRNPDNSKAKRLLGWAPSVGVAEGIASVCHYLQGRPPSHEPR